MMGPSERTGDELRVLTKKWTEACMQRTVGACAGFRRSIMMWWGTTLAVALLAYFAYDCSQVPVPPDFEEPTLARMVNGHMRVFDFLVSGFVVMSRVHQGATRPT